MFLMARLREYARTWRTHLLLTLAGACCAVAATEPAPVTELLESVKVSSALNGFAADLELARAEAMRRNSRVVLCKSANGDSCADSGAWSQGWIVFDDANGSGEREPGERLIVREAAFSRSLRFTGSLNAVRSVSFTAAGAAKLVGAALESGTLTVCRRAFQAGEARRVSLRAGSAPEISRSVVNGC